MADVTTESILHRLGSEEPGLFSAWWSGDPATVAELAGELIAGGRTAEELTERLIALHGELGRALRKRTRSVTVLTDTDIEVARALTACRREAERQEMARGECLSAAASASEVPPPGSLAPARWPTRLRRSLGGAGGPRACQEAETAERDR